MNVLVIYGQNELGRKLMLRLTKEGYHAFCIDDKRKGLEKIYAEKEYSLEFAESLQAAFRINNFDGVIYLGDSLIDYDRPHSKGGILEHTFLLCNKYNVKHFMYVCQKNYELSPVLAARKSIDEHICNKYVNIFKGKFKIVAFDNIYGEGVNCGLALKLLRDAENNAECSCKGKANLVHVDDAVDLLWRVWNDVTDERVFVLKSSACAVDTMQLYKKFQILLGNAAQNSTAANENAWSLVSSGEDSRFVSGIKWKPKYKIADQLPALVDWYKSRLDEPEAKKTVNFWKTIQPYFENLVLFCILVFISSRFQANNTVNGITQLDLSYVYIIIIGLLYGKKQTVWAIFLSCACLIYRYMSYGADLVGIFYRTEPMIQMATYMFIGTVVGYVTDSKNKTLEELKQQFENLKKRFDFLFSNYLEAVSLKDTFYKQVLNNSNSLGKSAQILKQLESVRRDQLYIVACNVVCEFLGVDNVALYTVGRNKYYFRLRVRRGEYCASLPQSLKIESNSYLLDVVEKEQFFINKSLQKDVPDMAAPILFGDKIIAVIQLYHIPFDKFSAQSEIMLKVVSLLIAAAVRRAVIFEDLMRDKMFFPDTRIMRREYFTEHLEEAERQEAAKESSFRAAEFITLDGISVAYIVKQEAYTGLWGRLDRLIREEDVVGLTKNGSLEALFFNLPESSVQGVTDRLKKEGIEIKWVEK